jgi:hypothetical protein
MISTVPALITDTLLKKSSPVSAVWYVFLWNKAKVIYLYRISGSVPRFLVKCTGTVN